MSSHRAQNRSFKSRSPPKP